MKINRKGITRLVIEFEKIVIKIPKINCWSHFLLGLIGNIGESKTWKYNSGKYEKGISRLLCPVVWCSCGGWILVMKKAYVFSREDWADMGDFENYIIEHKKYFAGDDKQENYGIYKGKIVKIDYV